MRARPASPMRCRRCGSSRSAAIARPSSFSSRTCKRGARLYRQTSRFLEIERVRSDQHRLSHGAALEQILAAERHQTAADERDVAGRIEGIHLAQAVAQQNPR